MHQMTLQALSLHIEHLFQCMHSSQDRRRMHYSVCSLLWVRRKSDKFRWKLPGEGYLSSRTPFRRGHSDSWTGWTWNALICCGSPLPNYCQLGCAACVFAKSGWCACMSLSVPSACVCQSSRQRGGGRGGGEGGGGLTVRPSLSLVCPSSAVPFRHVPVAFALNPPSPSPPTDAIKAGLSEQHRNQAARDAIIPASRSRPTCCDADIKHQDRVGGRYW